MCGIAGFELRGDEAAVGTRLLEQLARRGPDGGWCTRQEPYAFVQTRLAVIDLSPTVRYPMQNESGELSLLFNGEIYGHEELRAQLAGRGYHFATRCDAEVVLHGYEEWGMELFRRLDGMFALALFDVRTRELLLVRDGLGIKPLSYTASSRFAFASDGRALVAAGLVAGEIDEDDIAAYLTFAYVPPPGTGIRDLRQLSPGEALSRSADGRIRTFRWRPRPFTSAGELRAPSVSEASAALDRTVARQLVADVPVGVFLSSGVDSALVLDSAVRAGVRPTAFTIGFKGHRDYDEAAAAGRLCRELGVPHVVEQLDLGFAAAMELITGAYDQPLADSSAIAMLSLARLARREVTVALSGTGGDDLFAGYYRHRMPRLHPLLRRIPPRLISGLAHLSRRRGGERATALSLARSYLHRLGSPVDGDEFSLYLSVLRSSTAFSGDARVLRRAGSSGRGRSEIMARHTDETGAHTPLRRIQAFELATYLPGDLLLKEDRATMAFGLEARVPLLGNELLNLAEATPDNQKARLLSGKRLLRAVARERLPSHVSRARKRGFAVPLHDLFAGPWHSAAREWFASSSSELLDGPALAGLLAESAVSPTDAWTAAVLMGWENSIAAARRAGARVALRN